MPIVRPSDRASTPETRYREAMLDQPTQIGPDTGTTGDAAALPDDRGLVQTIIDANEAVLSTTRDPNNLVNAHMRRSGVVSALATDTLFYGAQNFGTGNDIDPNFNPYDLLDEKFARRYPFLVEHFESGRVLDFANEDRFWNWARRIEQDFDDRETMGQHGFLTNVAASIPSLAIDGVAAGAAIRAFGLKNSAAHLEAWRQRGNALSRTAKTGLVFGTINLAQEEMLRGANPERNVDEVEAAAMAFGMGLAFGAAIPALGAARKGASIQLAERKVRRIQEQTAEYFASPRAENARQLVADSQAELRRMIDADEAPDSVTAIVNKDTEPLIAELSKKYPDIEVVTHPDQFMVEVLESMDRVEKMAGKAMAAKGTNAFSTKYATLLSQFAPAERIRRSGSSVARRVARTLWDDTTATTESVNMPLSNTANSPAEGIRWNYDTWYMEAQLGIQRKLTDALKGKGRDITYTFADGERVTMKKRDTVAFGRATIDYMRRAQTAQRLGREMPEASQAIRDAAEDIQAYTKAMGDEATSVRFLKSEVDGGNYWLPQRWKTWEVQRRAKEFKDRLYAAGVKNRQRDFNTGKVLTENDRVIDDAVLKFERDGRDNSRGLTPDERKQILDWMEKNTDERFDLVEADLRRELGDDLMRRYTEEADLRLRGQVDSTYESLVLPDNGHGVTHAMGNDSFKRRLLQIDQDEFTDFLVEDFDSLIGGYHRQVAGRVATRYAISKDTDLLADMKALGFDLEKADYDPNVLMKAVRQDFDDQIKIARESMDEKTLDRLEAEQSKVLRTLESKLDELQGVPMFQNNPGTWVGWKLALQLPTMAFLGKVAVSSLTDLASHAFTKGLTPKHIKQSIRSVNMLKEVPEYGLEALYVANSDLIRATRALGHVDLDNLGELRQFGPGMMGRALEATDRLSDAATQSFFKLAGMNRWNRNQKRWMSHLVMTEFMRGAKLMAKAQRLTRNGMSEIDAVQKVGLKPEDARLLNRLGINGPRSERLMTMMTEHGRGLDLKTGAKKAWKNQAEFEQYDGYVSPEFYSWWDKDRDLFDTMTGAVNRHVQDLIVEPKMMSRPLINNTWLGRLFNQFQSFAFAWGNQHAQLAAQRPLFEQLGSLVLGVGVAGIVDALHNQLSGRRSFDETAARWADNPQAMVYGAINRSALTGWLVRPIGLLEQTPLGLGKLLGNTELSGTYSRPIKPSGFLLGPFGSWADNTAVALMQSAYDGEINDKRKRQMWNAMPYHNLWFIDAALRAAEASGIQTPQFVSPRARD